MNRRQLQKLGVPPTLVDAAVDALGEAASQDLGFGLKGKRARELVRQVVVSPTAFLGDPVWGALAAAILRHDEESGGEG
jgi:tRNA-splicing ligase RtcB (3'-phosphate/5'-hydroxy nucleic acid ligase)